MATRRMLPIAIRVSRDASWIASLPRIRGSLRLTMSPTRLTMHPTTRPVHGEQRGIPHVLLEIRNNEITHEREQKRGRGARRRPGPAPQTMEGPRSSDA